MARPPHLTGGTEAWRGSSPPLCPWSPLSSNSSSFTHTHVLDSRNLPCLAGCLSLSLTKWATTTQGHCGPGKAGELGDGPPGALRPAWSRKSQMVSGLRDGVSVCAWVQAPAPCVPATWPRPHSSLTHIGRRRAEAQAVSCHVDILCPPLGSVSRATARNTCLGRHPHCPGPLRALS